MSFDLFVGHFTKGSPSTFKRKVIEDAFKSFITSTDNNCLTVGFDSKNEECSYIYLNTESELIDGFNINRPKNNIKLYKILLEVLREGNFVLYMPGSCPPLVGRESTIAHIPHDMVEALGAPITLKSETEILDWIQSG